MKSFLYLIVFSLLIFCRSLLASTICLSHCSASDPVELGRIVIPDIDSLELGRIVIPNIDPVELGRIVIPDADSTTGGELSSLRRDTLPGEPSAITVTGDLYLDYSIFSSSTTLNINGEISLRAEATTFYQYTALPDFPRDSYAVFTFNDSGTIFDGYGNWVLFSDVPFVDGSFEATGNLYVGNYSALAPTPVPIPAAGFLLVCALLSSVLFKLKSIINLAFIAKLKRWRIRLL